MALRLLKGSRGTRFNFMSLMTRTAELMMKNNHAYLRPLWLNVVRMPACLPATKCYERERSRNIGIAVW